MARLRTKPFQGLDGRYHYTYLTTNLVNGKQYVGDRTCDKLPDKYIGSGSAHFNRAKKKYGKENFTKVILAFFPTREQAHAFEEPMIKKYGTLSPNGYNISPTGGLGNGGGRHAEESKLKLSENNGMHRLEVRAKHRDAVKIARNKPGASDYMKTPEWSEKQKIAQNRREVKEKKSKPVVQYALAGTFLQTFIGAWDAMLQTGVHEVNIGMCCKGSRPVAGGFQWRYYEGNTDDIEPITPIRLSTKPVAQYALDGTFLQTFIGMRGAMFQTGVYEQSIGMCCKGYLHSAGGFQWRYYEGNTDDIEPCRIRNRAEVNARISATKRENFRHALMVRMGQIPA